ncbi:MAG: helix-hairpin-helix domain-containing protein [bacterium]|nr:helix-hairpin-helix domain-containing protein [bacterium]
MNGPTSPESRLLALVNGAKDPLALWAVMDPGENLGITVDQVERLLSARDRLPSQHFESIGEISEVLDAPSLKPSGWALLPDTAWQSHPILLLPVRLETRFIGDVLRVRIYPDQIFVDSHDPTLTAAELAAAHSYHHAPCGRKRQAWRVLSSRFGPRRASWLVRWGNTHDFDGPEAPVRSKMWERAPSMSPLPDRFWIHLRREGAPDRAFHTNPVKQDRSILGLPEVATDGLFDERSAWMHDFEAAQRDGFAVEIRLRPADMAQGFDRVVAVGVKSTTAAAGASLIEDLVDAHHYTDGMGFVPHGTPTNNTDDEGAGYSSGEDHEASFDIEVQGPLNWEAQAAAARRTNAHRLGDALGIDATRMRHVTGSGSIADSYASDMNAVTWPVSGDYFLRHMLDGVLTDEQLEYVSSHVTRYVRGRGPLPTIRVGRQPYGVLPVTRTGAAEDVPGCWAPWQDDGDGQGSVDADRAMQNVVGQLHNRWRTYADDPTRVPRVQFPDDADELNPDETLLRILSMEPRSVSYQARPFVESKFVAFLLMASRHFAFKEGSFAEDFDPSLTPLEWSVRWSTAWEAIRDETAELLGELTSNSFGNQLEPPSARFLETTLLQTLSWGIGEGEPLIMVENPASPETRPFIYMRELCRRVPRESQTLLADVAQRALDLAANPTARLRVADAICQLATAAALEFFNSVTTPDQIVQRIHDDPLRDASHGEAEPYAYGIRPSLAQEILDVRERFGGRFNSIDQIDAIGGMGPDTEHDILYTFRNDDNQPDIDGLFRESLDVASHRVDAWMTSFATKRLHGIRSQDATSTGLHVGAYGFVENLRPPDEPPSLGYFHAPSSDQAAAAAVLFNAFLTHGPDAIRENDGDLSPANPFRVNLTSHRVRHSLRLLEGVRQGQPLGALLGYQFERMLQDNKAPLEQYIDEFRERFPIVADRITPGDPSKSSLDRAARTVLDGLALLRDKSEEGDGMAVAAVLGLAGSHAEALRAAIDELTDRNDAVGDLLMTESVYQAVRGNFDRSGAALDAAHGVGFPPEIECVKTPLAGRRFGQRTCLLFTEDSGVMAPSEESIPKDPFAAAEPRIAGWFESMLGNPDEIGLGFDFWQPDEILDRVDVNTASAADLATIDGVGPALADAIIGYRVANGRFKYLSDLTGVSGIAVDTVIEAMAQATTGYVDRVDVNSAPPDVLEAALGPAIAAAIVMERTQGRFHRVDDLRRVRGIGEARLEHLRQLVTTGRTTVDLHDLGFTPASFLYAATKPIGEGASEIELRLSRWVREEYGLPPEQRVVALPAHAGTRHHSVADACELASHALSLLASGTPLRPDSLSHPGEVQIAGYTEPDAQQFRTRVKQARGWFDEALNLLNDGPQKKLTTEELRELLDLVARLGIRDVAPAGLNDPNLHEKLKSARDVLQHRVKACDTLLTKATDASIGGGHETLTDGSDVGTSSENDPQKLPSGVADGAIDLLTKAAQALFGGSFVMLPAFEPHQTGDLAAALHQDSLNGLGPERLRLWLQQTAQVSADVATLEDMLMIEEAWSQSSVRGIEPSLRLEVAQLPHTEDRPWLGLSAIEAAPPETPTPERGRRTIGDVDTMHADNWSLSPLSIIAAIHGPLPAKVLGGEKPVMAGLSIDYCDEVIPDDHVTTSVAFQFDAPSSQAPQTLLLAVPSQVKPSPDAWTHNAVADIVHDTIDLAKVRTVDIDALASPLAAPGVPQESQGEPIGAILPGIFLPTDPHRADWASTSIQDAIGAWVEQLEPTREGCVSGTLEYPTLDTGDNPVRRLESAPGLDMNLYAPGLDHAELYRARIRAKGSIRSMSNRVFVKDYEVIEFPPGFERVTLRGTLDWSGATEEAPLVFSSHRGLFTLQGGAAIEVGKFPRSLDGLVSIDGKIPSEDGNITVEPVVTLGAMLSPSKGDGWVQSYEFEVRGRVAIPGPDPRSVPFHNRAHIGIVNEDPSGRIVFTSRYGNSYVLVGSHDSAEMRALIGARIWFLEMIEVSGSDLLTSTGIEAGIEVGGAGETRVAAFGLLREKEAIVTCDE